jgi:membrane protease YdiL (CAAX protease family)
MEQNIHNNSHKSVAASPRIWNFWATTGFSIVIFMGFLAGQSIAIGIYTFMKVSQSGTNPAEFMNSLGSDGSAIAYSVIPGALIGALFVILFAGIRKNISIRDYLELHPFRIKSLLFWIGVFIALNIGMEVLNHLLDRPMPEWMIHAYKSAGNYPLFFFAIIVAAPVFEELFFRGFLFEGLRHSWPGAIGAILITSAFWAVIHMQYDWFDVASIFVIGLVLGYAKIKTGSLYVTIILHMLLNLIATIMVALYLNEKSQNPIPQMVANLVWQ